MRILCFKKQTMYVEYYAGNLPKSTFLHHVPSTFNLFLLASKFFFGQRYFTAPVSPVRTIEITEGFHTSQQIHDMTFRPNFLWTSFCWPNLASLGCFFLKGCSSHSGHCCNHRLNWSKGMETLLFLPMPFTWGFYWEVSLFSRIKQLKQIK